MTKNIFISSVEPFTGKSVIALGLINMILGKTKKVGYFKPIIVEDDTHKRELHIDTILNHFSLPIAYEDTFAFSRRQMLEQIEADSRRDLISTIIDKYKKLEDNYDFTVIEGSDFLGEGIAFEFESNIAVAKNLGAPVLLVITGENKSTSQIISSAMNALHNFESRDVQVIGIIANRVNAEQRDDVEEILKLQLSKELLIAVIPWDQRLQSPIMQEICNTLNAKVIFWGQPAYKPGGSFCDRSDDVTRLFKSYK
ncbi:AAA family ATPase [Flavitalea sp.]|nr:AAA family ATPase [Flavitalea sp.]